MVRSVGTGFLTTIQAMMETTITSQSMRRKIARLRSIRLYFCIGWPSFFKENGAVFPVEISVEKSEHYMLSHFLRNLVPIYFNRDMTLLTHFRSTWEDNNFPCSFPVC